MATFPTLKAEILFTNDPGIGEGDDYVDTYGDVYESDWEDVSNYLLPPISTSRGRQRELDQFQPGSFSFVLANEDRRFDPANTSSPYYPNVIPNRRCRIKAVHPTTAVEYPVIDGYIDSWPPVWNVSTATVTVTATDGMKLLGRAELPEAVYAGEVLKDEPLVYYRLNESDDDAQIAGDSSGNGRNGTYEGSPVHRQSDPITDDADGAVQLPTGSSGIRGRTNFGGTGTYSIEFWFRTTEGTAYRLVHQGINPASEQNGESAMGMGSTQKASWVVTGGTGTTLDGTTTINTGAWFHIVGTRETDGTLRLYVNGAQEATGNNGAVNQLFENPLWIGLNPNIPGPYYVDEVAFYDQALTPARILGHYNARNSWDNDLSGARVTRVLDFVDWSATDRSIESGQSILQSEVSLGGSALQYLQKVADSEFGSFYISKDGKAKFRERHSLLKAPYTTVQTTLADDGTGHMFANPQFEFDDLQIRNDVTIDRAGGWPQHVKDVDSIGKFFLSSYSRTNLLNEDDDELRDAANYILGKYKDPFTQITSIVLEPHAEDTDGTLWTQVLTRELEDRVRVKATPPGGGPAINKELHIQGISHEIGPGPVWKTTWDLSQADAVQSYWILGTSGLGVDTVLAY